MRPALQAVAAPQGGIFSRAQAVRAGYTEREIKALTRPTGEWTVVRLGVYCERARMDPLDSRSRWLLKDRAAVLSTRRPVTMSHDSAARLLAIDTLDPPSPASHLTLYGPRGSRTNSGLTQHRDLLPLCVERVDGLVSTSTHALPSTSRVGTVIGTGWSPSTPYVASACHGPTSTPS